MTNWALKKTMVRVSSENLVLERSAADVQWTRFGVTEQVEVEDELGRYM